eukprot:1392048-Amorphochlora_amoeboformis.AAC.1
MEANGKDVVDVEVTTLVDGKSRPSRKKKIDIQKTWLEICTVDIFPKLGRLGRSYVFAVQVMGKFRSQNSKPSSKDLRESPHVIAHALSTSKLLMEEKNCVTGRTIKQPTLLRVWGFPDKGASTFFMDTTAQMTAMRTG